MKFIDRHNLGSVSRGVRSRRSAVTTDIWLGLGIVLVASVLRFYEVETVPWAIHFDESGFRDAVEVIREANPLNIFRRMTEDEPDLLLVPQLFFRVIFDNEFAACRYAGALWGVLSIIATFAAARRLYSPGIALAASLFLTFSYWHLVVSRQLQCLSAAFAAAAMWYGIARFCDSRRLRDAALAGLIVGLGLELFGTIKVMLVILPSWWIFHAIATPRFARDTAIGLVVTVITAAAVLYPLLSQVGWERYFTKVLKLNVVGTVIASRVRFEGQTGSEGLLSELARLARVVTGGARLAPELVSPVPLVEWTEVSLAGLGLIICLCNWRSWRATVAPFWLGLTIVAVTMSSVPESGHWLAVALPAFAILAATGVLVPLTWLRRKLPKRAGALATSAALAAGILVYDVRVNATKTLGYIRQMDRSAGPELGRFISAGPLEAVYYVHAPRSHLSKHNFRSLTHRHQVVGVPNLTDDIPRLVDTAQPAEFMIPYWASDQSLPYLRHLYPEGTLRPLVDPSGFTVAYALSVAAGVRPDTTAIVDHRSCCRLE